MQSVPVSSHALRDEATRNAGHLLDTTHSKGVGDGGKGGGGLTYRAPNHTQTHAVPQDDGGERERECCVSQSGVVVVVVAAATEAALVDLGLRLAGGGGGGGGDEAQ